MAPRKSDLAWAKDHRYVVEPGGKPMPGVTSIIDQVEKANVEKWLLRSDARGLDPLAERKLKQERGTRVHEHAVYWNDPDYHPEDADWYEPEDEPWLDALDAFWHDCTPVPILQEQKVLSARYGYGGTVDLLAEITWYGDRVYAMLDYKTGSRQLTGPAMQLAAYSNADGVGVYVNEWLTEIDPFPVGIERLGTVFLHGDGTYELYSLPPSFQGAFDAFLGLLTYHQWVSREEARQRKEIRDHRN